MGPNFVVFFSPVRHHAPAFTQGKEQFPSQAFSTKLVVKTLNIAILPRASWFDVERLDLLVFQPLAELFTDKLWAIV